RRSCTTCGAGAPGRRDGSRARSRRARSWAVPYGFRTDNATEARATDAIEARAVPEPARPAPPRADHRGASADRRAGAAARADQGARAVHPRRVPADVPVEEPA